MLHVSCVCAFRDEEEVQFSLADFKCVAVLGRGHFGKVNFMLLCLLKGKYKYANAPYI